MDDLRHLLGQFISASDMAGKKGNGKFPLFIYYHDRRIHFLTFYKWGNAPDSNAAGADKNNGVAVCKSGFCPFFDRLVHRLCKILYIPEISGIFIQLGFIQNLLRIFTFCIGSDLIIPFFQHPVDHLAETIPRPAETYDRYLHILHLLSFVQYYLEPVPFLNSVVNSG